MELSGVFALSSPKANHNLKKSVVIWEGERVCCTVRSRRCQRAGRRSIQAKFSLLALTHWCNGQMRTALPRRSRKKRQRGRGVLYHSAKISERTFKAVLWEFTLDRTLTDAAKATGLSTNSVAAIFTKLRVYFAEAGLFTDPRLIGMFEDNEEFERHFLAFHLGRARSKRGLAAASSAGRDYHMAESHWRFHFHMIALQRPSENVAAMMFAHLLALIRICGPVGRKPVNPREGRLEIFRQTDQRLLWLERNAPEFRSPSQRAELRAIRNIRPV